METAEKLGVIAVFFAILGPIPAWLPPIERALRSSETHRRVSASLGASSSATTSRTNSSSTSTPAPAPTLAPSNEKTHIYSTPTGEVWVKLSRLPGPHVSTYVVSLSWGAKHRVQQVTLGSRPVYLTMNKSGTDRTPLIVTTQPAARIDFGRAALGAASSIGIDAGWTSS